MKSLGKKIVLYLSLCIIILSCKEQTNKKISLENEDRIEKILIQFYPSFHESSLILLDLSKREQTFQRIGSKIYYKPIPPNEVVKKYAPKSINFQIDSLSYSYLRDSIAFNKEDFIDKEVESCDGIFHSILYVFDSGKIEDVDLYNSLTENERKLILKLIDLIILQSTDSLTTEYLKSLEAYHYNTIEEM